MYIQMYILCKAYEEVGVRPHNVKLTHKGINKYGRYCYLLHGESNEQPKVKDLDECSWAKYCSIKELENGRINNQLTFVSGFFEDLMTAGLYGQQSGLYES